MSFNDIPEFRKALERLTIEYPKLVRAGERSLLWVIVGWPNGCFIGEESMANQAGLAISTKDTYLRSLTKLGFIHREQTYARKGLQQCYWVNVRNMTSYECLSPVIAISNSELPTVDKSLPITGEPKASDPLQAYKDYKDYKYDKERFDYVILKNTPKELKDAVTPGDNLENLLNELEHHGTSQEAVGAHLNALNWSGVNQPGGFIVKALSTFLSQRKEINLERIAQQTASDNYQAERDKAERDRADPADISALIEKVRTDLIAKRKRLET